jgi:penicillin-binding protein 1A
MKQSFSFRRGCLQFMGCASVLCLAILLAGTTATVSMLNHYAEGLPDVSRLRYYEPSETTRIFSSDGKPIATLFKENRTWTKLEDMSPYISKAIVAVEDGRFFEHRGIDPIGVIRAVVYDALHRGAHQGASTITMQLARNLFLSPDQNMERKVKEMLLATQIEKKFTKNEILELYLNQIYFGGGAYGIGQAAKTYYGKDAKKLTVAEAALICGLPQAPSEFSPLVNEKAAKHRQILVLGRMLETNAITYPEYRQALKETQHPKFVAQKKQEFQTLELPYFTTYVIKQLYARYEEDLLYRGGLRITTTVDSKLQEAAEEAVRELILTQGPGLRADAAALVCIENKTGFIKAMAGGTGWSKKNQFNRAWQARRHPGSSFKVIVYSAAIEAGYSPDTIINDAPLTIQVSPTEEWKPKNSDGHFAGPISIRTALQQSRNIVAVKLLQFVGVDRVIELAYRMGITEKLFPNPSLALGATEISVMEMASAYTVIPNMGMKYEITPVKTIVDSEGHSVEDHTYPKSEEVLSEITALIMSDMMTNVVEHGTATMAQLPGYKVAGKTGTTDDYRDAWFVGFTPQYTCAVWVGNDNNGQMINSFGGNLPAQIWRRFMSKAMQGQPFLPFGQMVDGKVSVSMCSDSKRKATNGCLRTTHQLFAPGSVPAGYCTDHIRTGDSKLPNGKKIKPGTTNPLPPDPDDALLGPPFDDPSPAASKSPEAPASTGGGPEAIPAPPGEGPGPESSPEPAGPAPTPHNSGEL